MVDQAWSSITCSRFIGNTRKQYLTKEQGSRERITTIIGQKKQRLGELTETFNQVREIELEPARPWRIFQWSDECESSSMALNLFLAKEKSRRKNMKKKKRGRKGLCGRKGRDRSRSLLWAFPSRSPLRNTQPLHYSSSNSSDGTLV